MAKHGDIATRAQLHGIKFIGARAYNNTSQSVPNSTATALTLNTEDYDTDSIHSTSSNTSRMTVPSGMGGYWFIKASSDANAGGTAGNRAIWLRKNGSDVIGTSVGVQSSNQEEKMITTAILNLAAGDYIEAFAFQVSGGALNYGSSTNDEAYTCVEAWYLGPSS